MSHEQRSSDAPAAFAERSLFIALLLVLYCAPLPLASNRPWAKGLLVLAVWFLVALTVLYSIWRKDHAARVLTAASGPIGCLAAFCAVVAVQLVVLPAEIRSWFVIGATRSGPISIDPSSTRLYLLSALTYLGGFVLTLLLVQGRRRLLALSLSLVCSGLTQALIGVTLLSVAEPYVYLGNAFPVLDRASGTFVDPDHFANYLALCLSAGLGLMLAQFAPEAPPHSVKERGVRLLRFVMSARMLIRLMLVVMVIALVLTRSRMGNLAFFAALLLVGVFIAWRSPKLRHGAMWLVASLIVVDIIVVGQWVGLDQVVRRLQETAVASSEKTFAHTEESLEERIAPTRYAFKMIAERPLMGFGGGTFHTAFTRFKGTEASLLSYDHLHNDYGEIAADTGLLGLSILAIALLLSARRVVSLVDDGEPRHQIGLAAGTAMAAIAILIHAAVDFPLQIPANALTFTVLLGTVWTMNPRRRRLATKPAVVPFHARGHT